MSVAPLSSNTVVAGNYALGRDQVAKPASQSGGGADGVKLSGKALAKSLKAQGLTPSQIALTMNSDLKTVYDYLGITPPPSDASNDEVKLSGKALAKSLKEQGMTPWQIAMMMGSDLKTVDDYLGISTVPTRLPTPVLYNSTGKISLY